MGSCGSLHDRRYDRISAPKDACSGILGDRLRWTNGWRLEREVISKESIVRKIFIVRYVTRRVCHEMYQGKVVSYRQSLS
jgi:hypothetical protein